MRKKIISLILILLTLCSFCSCNNKNQSQKENNVNKIIYKSDKNNNTKLKVISDEENNFLSIDSSCIFKNSIYYFARKDITLTNDPHKLYTEYVVNHGQTDKYNIPVTYNFLYCVCFSENSCYTLEGDDTDNFYIVKYSNSTFQMEKSVQIDMIPVNCKMMYSRALHSIILSSEHYNAEIDSDLQIKETDSIISEPDCDNSTYDFSFDKKSNTYVLTKYNKENNVIYQSDDFADFLSESNTSDAYLFLQNNDPVACCSVYASSGIVQLVNIIDRNNGKTTERYEIKGAEYIWGGNTQYKFLYLKDNSIYGYNSSDSSDLIFRGNSEVILDPYRISVECFEDSICILDFTIPEVTNNYFLIQSDTQGKIISSIPYEEPLDPSLKYILKPDVNDEHLYLFKYTIGEDFYPNGTTVEISDDGCNFSKLFSVSDVAQNTFIDSNGYIYFSCITQEGAKICIYKNDGSLINTITSDMKYVNAFNICNNETYVFYTDIKDNVKQGKISIDNSQIYEITDIPFSNENYIIYGIKEKEEISWHYYDVNKNTIFKYITNKNQTEEIMQLSDYNINMVNNLIVPEDGNIIITTENKIYKEINVNAENIKVIKIAGINISPSISEKIEEYNMSHTDYSIECVDYQKYKSGSENSPYERLDMDIVSGQIPDIIITDSYFDKDKYIKSGLFTDLYPYIENDPGINKNDYFTSLFKASEYDSKLIQIIPSFYAETFIDKGTDDLSFQSWNSFFDTVADPEKSVGYDNSVMDPILFSSFIHSYVDLKKPECSFDNEVFINLLDAIKKMRNESNKNKSDDINNTEDKDLNIIPLIDMINGEYIIDNKSDDVIFSGIPSENNSGAFIVAYLGMSITEKSQYKDQSWSFIREFLLDDYQNEILGQSVLPAKKSSLEYSIKNFIGVSEYNKKHLEDYMSFMERNMIINNSFGKIYNIISDETAGFFADSISAQETAKIIQSKVNLYLKEYY